MKLNSKMRITVLAKEAKTSATTGKESYSLAIMQGAEAGSITCTKEVYDTVEPLHAYDFAGTYDDRYNYMKLTDVDAKTKSAIGK